MTEKTVSTCKSCGAKIVWIEHEGKKIPLNYRRVGTYYEAMGKIEPWGPMWISHFVTCPQASKWSGGKR